MIDAAIPDLASLGVLLITGSVIGSIYFGALWLTVRHLAHQKYPGAMLLLSLTLRLALLLSVFFLILDGGHWQSLLVAVIGFIAARTVFIRRHVATVVSS